MSVKTILNQIEGIVFRATQKLLIFIPSTGREGSALRLVVGDLNAFINQYVMDGTFADRLLICFRQAVTAGITLDWMDEVLKQLFTEREPLEDLPAIAVVQNSIIFALAAEARIIAATEYESRDDVETTMKRMNIWFDQAKEFAADEMANPSYLSIVDLHATTTRYLADISRPLPRMVAFEIGPQPALTAANRIYGDGSRWEELVAENKVVHPAFCMPVLRGLSE
jgi:hypothetical protein